ncbi:amino acid adenylation domain-containing protein [Streptomyces sp. NRRL F-5650]|uniref:amino acid adenylation domain-containing protein n=1 Tax=Streptomyces sp. NRRL F-5650 TaxID=1463868 RepID=UPI00068C0B4B|nr:amino acid adenylation domain-containing protein [Streptomyces sp. NRRL F-5650]
MTTPAGTFSCCLIGENTLLVSCAELLLQRGHDVVRVVSPPGAVRDWAAERGLPVSGFGPGLAGELAARPFDHLFSIANLRMLPEEVLRLPRGLAVNFHDALLPDHAGVHATAWALTERAPRHGVTWHVMTEEADAGDVLVQRAFDVADDETSHSLNVKCFDAGTESFADLVDRLATGRAERHPQDLSKRRYHGRYDRPADAGLLSWTTSAADLAAAVRARDFGPHPNGFGSARIWLGDGFATVSALEATPERSGRRPGSVLAAAEGTAVVATADHDVRLTGVVSCADLRPLPAHALPEGTVLPEPGGHLLAAAHAAQSRALRAEPHWVRTLGRLAPLDPPAADHAPHAAPTVCDVPVPPAAQAAAAAAGVPRAHWLAAALLGFLTRAVGGGDADVDFAVSSAASDDALTGLYASHVPLRLPELRDGLGMAEWSGDLDQRIEAVVRRGTYAQDVWQRYPALRSRRFAGAGLPVAVEITDGSAGAAALPRPGTCLLLRLTRSGDACQWVGTGAAEDVRRIAGHAAAFLAAVAGPAGADLTTAPVCTDADRRRALVEWNATATGPAPARHVHELFERQARRTPHAPAVTCAGTTLTYAELDHRADELAAHLSGSGIGGGDAVGVYLDRSPLLPTVLLAVLKAGAAYVPLDPIYPRDRIAHMVDDSRLRLIVTEQALAGNLPAGHADVLVADRPWPAPAGTAGPQGDRVPREAGSDLAYVIYTSGSTGRPKGVRVTHAALVNFLVAMTRSPGIGEGDRLLAVTTVCFDIAGLELYGPLSCGGEVELAPTATTTDGFALRTLVEQRRPTVMQATPATWRMLIEAGWSGTPGLRIWCGGEALPAELAETLLSHGAQVWNLYGPTETTIWSSVARVRAGSPVTIGRPIDNTQFYVLDPRMRPVAPGLPGELYIGGAGVALGYLNRPELTEQRFVRNVLDPTAGRLYRTGDLVRHLPDGQLVYVDRADHQVKVHGYRIEPGEIESVLSEHPAVARAVVVVREDLPGDRRLAAYLVTQGAAPDTAELRRLLADRLPAYMIPAAFVRLDSLPLTANGKIDRRALPRPGGGAGPGAALPSGSVERTVARAWQEVLGTEDLGLDDNFFESGGNSLLLMQLMARLRERFDASVTRVEMFKYPTVRAMARHLAAGRSTGPGDAPRPRAAVRGRARGRGALADLRGRRARRPGRDTPSA